MPLPIPEQKIARIKELRSNGYSIPEISTLLSLPKSSVFRYIQGIELNSYGLKRLESRQQLSSKRKEARVDEANTRAHQLVPHLTDTHQLLIATALYWAEGSKNELCFTNSDPEMVRLFVKSLRNCHNVRNEDLTVYIRLNAGSDREAALDHWSHVIGHDIRESAHIHLVNAAASAKMKFGTCRLRVKKSSQLHKLHASLIRRIIELSHQPLERI